MDFLTAKEARVEKAWSKRGLIGLRNDLLKKVAEKDFNNINDDTFLKIISVVVYGILPKREWEDADTYILETCGLAGFDAGEVDGWEEVILKVRLAEDGMREDIGDE